MKLLLLLLFFYLFHPSFRFLQAILASHHSSKQFSQGLFFLNACIFTVLKICWQRRWNNKSYLISYYIKLLLIGHCPYAFFCFLPYFTHTNTSQLNIRWSGNGPRFSEHGPRQVIAWLSILNQTRDNWHNQNLCVFFLEKV